VKARRILRHAVMILNGVLVVFTVIALFPNLPYSFTAYFSKAFLLALTGNVIANSFLALYLDDKEASE